MSESTTNSLCWHRLTTVLYLWIIGARVRSRTKYVNKHLLAVCNCILQWENIQLIIIIIITKSYFRFWALEYSSLRFPGGMCYLPDLVILPSGYVGVGCSVGDAGQ